MGGDRADDMPRRASPCIERLTWRKHRLAGFERHRPPSRVLPHCHGERSVHGEGETALYSTGKYQGFYRSNYLILITLFR